MALNLQAIQTKATENKWLVMGVLVGKRETFVMAARLTVAGYLTAVWTGEAFVSGHYDLSREEAMADLFKRYERGQHKLAA